MQERSFPLSVVVIGRNESKNLPRLAHSLAPLRQALPCEWLYVDSASIDTSAEIACDLFDLTVVLCASENLNASAGRHIGVRQSKGEWVLFLDGDMELIADAVPAIVNHIGTSPSRVGAVGDYAYIDEKGEARQVRMRADASNLNARFGGAVLLSRESLRDYNWNPRLFANEEVELFTRLRAAGHTVRHLGCSIIQHNTEHLTFRQKLIGNFVYRRSFLGKKFLGFGQVLHSRFSDGSLGAFVRHYPDPFVFLTGLVFSLLALLAGQPLWSLLGVLCSIGFVATRTSVRSVIAYLGYLPQGWYGWRRFAAGWQPEVAWTHQRGTARASKP